MRFLKYVLVFTLFFSIILAPATFAQGDSTPADSEVSEVEEVDSYDMFWPIVAGRTINDVFFPLKRLKERVRGWFIFGSPQKCEYAIFLTKKRVVETEKLLVEGRGDLANKTLDLAGKEIEKADKAFQSAKANGEAFGNIGPAIVDDLTRVETLMAWLSVKFEANKSSLEDFLSKVQAFKSKL